MSKEDLIKKIEEFVCTTGYPFEQMVVHTLETFNWTVFNSVDYIIPPDQPRELDILAYKIINDRRIELRISCKQSQDKHWIFFTEENDYIRFGSSLKFTPVDLDIETYRRIPNILKDLLLFKYNRWVTNFTAFSEKKQDEARLIIKDGLYSALNSVYHRLFPHELICDQRGTIYFFITLFKGLMFESFYDPETNSSKIKQITYTQWNSELQLKANIKQLLKYNGRYVPYRDVISNFDNDFIVEIIQWDYFEEYLRHIEGIFNNLTSAEVNIFGKPFNDKYFPRAIMGKVLAR